MDKGAKEGSGLDFRKKIEKGIGKWKSSSLPLNSDLSREKKKKKKERKKGRERTRNYSWPTGFINNPLFFVKAGRRWAGPRLDKYLKPPIIPPLVYLLSGTLCLPFSTVVGSLSFFADPSISIPAPM